MSTIHSFTNGESGSTILGNLNDNFTALNADKIQDDSTDTLTNKTIDVDSNTVSNIETDNLKTSAKTGVDTKVVTGTQGDANEIAVWNADGDLVSSDITTETSLTNSDTKIPTSGAVYNYLQDFIDPSPTVILYPAYTYRGVQTYPYSSLTEDTAMASIQTSGDYCAFEPWYVPSNFGTITSFELVYEASGTSPATIQLGYDCTQPGELPGTGNADGGLSSSFSLTYTTAVLNVSDIYTGAGGSSLFANIAPTDYVGFRLLISTTDTLKLLMIKVTHTTI